MENLLYNTGPGAKFAFWTPTVTGAATAPLGTFSATSGPDSTAAGLRDLAAWRCWTRGGHRLIMPVCDD